MPDPAADADDASVVLPAAADGSSADGSESPAAGGAAGAEEGGGRVGAGAPDWARARDAARDLLSQHRGDAALFCAYAEVEAAAGAPKAARRAFEAAAGAAAAAVAAAQAGAAGSASLSPVASNLTAASRVHPAVFRITVMFPEGVHGTPWMQKAEQLEAGLPNAGCIVYLIQLAMQPA